MKKITVFTGAGVSVESGIQTFRGAGGLWHNHKIEDVAKPKGFVRNPQLVLDFYNERRSALKNHQPNAFHLFLKELENHYVVNIFTQNVDDLHERVGSSNVFHLHGSLLEACTDKPGTNVKYIGYENIKIGDKLGEKQYRPNIVFFEEIPFGIDEAKISAGHSDYLIIAGTSLLVQPASSIALRRYPPTTKKIYIDPNPLFNFNGAFDICIKKKVTDAIEDLKKILVG